jgi:beta-xylosidase
VHQKPAVKSSPSKGTVVPATTDEFDGPALGLQWQWQANPRNEWISLKSKPGSLRLNAVRSPSNTSLYDAPNLLLQKFPASTFTATTLLDLSAVEENAEAGLIVFGYSYGWIGLRREAMGLRLVQVLHVDAQKTPTDRVAATIPIEGHRVYLQVHVAADAKCRFAYSLDGTSFTPFGDELQATVARWVGAKVGLFSSLRNTAADGTPASYAEFDWFHVTP